MFQGAKIDIICQIANLSISKLMAKWALHSIHYSENFPIRLKTPYSFLSNSIHWLLFPNVQPVDNSVNNLLILIDNYFIAVLHFLHTFALAKQ